MGSWPISLLTNGLGLSQHFSPRWIKGFKAHGMDFFYCPLMMAFPDKSSYLHKRSLVGKKVMEKEKEKTQLQASQVLWAIKS